MKKIIYNFIILLICVPVLFAQQTGNEASQSSVTTQNTETVVPEKSKKFYWGFLLGGGMQQTIVPDSFSQAAYNAKSKPMFAFDIGATASLYFNKWLGITASLGYTYMPFQLEGEGSIPMPAVPIDVPIPGFSGTNNYTTFTGYLKGAMHYLFIKLGPSFKISDFFINLEAIIVIHLSSKYKLDLGNIDNSILGLVKMPEMSGEYKEARAAAIGLSITPGYRFDIGKSLFLPVALEFCIMLTPLGETNIAGYNLPKETIKTWYLKLKVGLEF